jgi:DNA-binding IclR family transcriptional regulator
MNKTTYKRITAAITTIDVLAVLADAGGPAAAGEIADAAGLHESTARSYLESLVDANAANRIGRRYQLGGRVPLIWARYRARLEADLFKINEELEELGNG